MQEAAQSRWRSLLKGLAAPTPLWVVSPNQSIPVDTSPPHTGDSARPS
jgi:hypothetical protein